MQHLGAGSGRRIQVFGPAYLDRVLKVDRPLLNPTLGVTADASVDGRLGPGGTGLLLADPAGGEIHVEPPPGWPGPTGVVRLSRALVAGARPWRRAVRGAAWHDDLGGMGAGFAAALGGTLISAVGPGDDRTTAAIRLLLSRAEVAHEPVLIPGQPADWTLLVTSAQFGDKLPVGFRGCHAAIGSLADRVDAASDVRIVAGLPNRLAEELLRAPGSAVRFFAPAARNILDADTPLAGFAEAVHFLSCNRREWSSLAGAERVDAAVTVLAITDGPRGSELRFRDAAGRRQSVRVAAFPRAHPPRDTNRAGEAFAATLLATLLDRGWTGGPLAVEQARHAALRASAAAALEIDLELFGFPTDAMIDAAIARGAVGPA